MKVLIWILTFFLGTALNTLIGYAIGIKAGAVLLYIAEYFVAKKLCEKWDEHKKEKESLPTDTFKQNDVDISDMPLEKGADAQAISEPTNTSDKKVIRYCRRCGFEIISKSEFCSNCGTKIETEVET